MKNNKIDKSTGGGESQLPAVVQEAGQSRYVGARSSVE
jgi:hypothetical protein